MMVGIAHFIVFLFGEWGGPFDRAARLLNCFGFSLAYFAVRYCTAATFTRQGSGTALPMTFIIVIDSLFCFSFGVGITLSIEGLVK